MGGISVTLLFQRAPFLSQIRSVWLPWNQFMVLDRVFMERAESKPPVCDLKNLISPHAVVLSAPLPRFAADCEDRGTVVPELQVQDAFTLRKHWMQYLRDYTRISVTQVSTSALFMWHMKVLACSVRCVIHHIHCKLVLEKEECSCYNQQGINTV